MQVHLTTFSSVTQCPALTTIIVLTKFLQLVDVLKLLILMLPLKAVTLITVLTVRNVHHMASKTLRTQTIVDGSIAVLLANGLTELAQIIWYLIRPSETAMLGTQRIAAQTVRCADRFRILYFFELVIPTIVRSEYDRIS